MKTAILLYVFISFVNGEICRKVFCEDNYAGEMKVTELKYNLTDVNSTFVENRVLKTMYFQKKVSQKYIKIHRVWSSNCMNTHMEKATSSSKGLVKSYHQHV